jgi:3-oxoacyl-[acyl-carrier protein] reductase
MRRSVLITGGSRGIGLAIAQGFLESGDRVAVAHRSSEAPGGALGIKCDVAVSEEVNRAFERAREEHGPVEVLVANAGVSDDMFLMGMKDEQFRRVLDINLGGAFYAARCAYPDMVRLRRGRMIFVSSVAGLRGSEGQANYAASKAGMVGLARSLARELGRRNVTVNVVAPGLVDTDMTSDLQEPHRKRILDDTPLARPGTTAEVASAVLWLASEEASYVTGAVLPVDGGLGMGH